MFSYLHLRTEDWPDDFVSKVLVPKAPGLEGGKTFPPETAPTRGNQAHDMCLRYLQLAGLESFPALPEPFLG